jgi:hypothetical protein
VFVRARTPERDVCVCDTVCVRTRMPLSLLQVARILDDSIVGYTRQLQLDFYERKEKTVTKFGLLSSAMFEGMPLARPRAQHTHSTSTAHK